MLRICCSIVMLMWFSQCLCQSSPNFYISNQGRDYYPGTSSLLAKKTIASATPLISAFASSHDSVSIALKSGSIFNENLITSYPITVNTYADQFDSAAPAIMNGTKEFDTGWNTDSGRTYTYKQGIPYSGFEGYGIGGIGSYSYMYVFEIDRSLEKVAPLTARKILQFVTSEAAVENTPGSFYSPVNTTENPKQMYIHTSDGKSPNNHSRYRYEVTVMDWAINATYQNGNSFENLWIRGFGAGNGMLPSGDHSYYNKVIFGPGAGIHHVVVRGGIIDHSLFLPAAKNTNDFAVVFYDVEGLQKHCTIKNSMFLNLRAPLYAHTSEGTNYGAIEMDNIVGFADSTEKDGFMFTSNTDSVFLNNIYADGYSIGYNYGSAKFASITNVYFKDNNNGIAFSAKNPVNAIVKNTFIKTKGTYSTGIIMQANTSLNLSNSIIHIKSLKNGAFISGSGSTGSFINAAGNIFICDIDSGNSLAAARANTDKGIGTAKDKWDNNVYILLKGKSVVWDVTNATTNNGKTLIYNFDDWKYQSGQDVHSLFFDLRNDPRGLKAIFADPDNGNYELANTPEGKQVAALHAGMIDPVTCFLPEPTYEEAAEIIKTGQSLSVNTCRNPCSQNSIKVNNSLNVTIVNTNQVKIQWTLGEQQNINYYELQRAAGNLLFERVAIVQTGQDSVYNFVDNILPGIIYQYRLLLVAKAGNVCYSVPKQIKIAPTKKFTLYPNPTKEKLFISMNGYVGKVKLRILNAAGRSVLQKEFFSLYSNQLIDISNEPKGIYFTEIETNEGMSTQKFVLE